MASFTMASTCVFVLHLSLISITLSLLFHPCLAVYLGLRSKDRCTFHMVSSYQTDLSERILNSNQYGQSWTVRNISQRMLKPPVDDKNLQLAHLYDWESRFCNVHLIIDSDSPFKGVGVWEYGAPPSVRDRHLTFVIWVVLMPSGPLKLHPSFLAHNLQYYAIGIHNSRAILTIWYCPSDFLMYKIGDDGVPAELDGDLVDTLYKKCGRNFAGGLVTVFHPRIEKSRLKTRCQHEGHPAREVNTAVLAQCLGKRKFPWFLVQKMNGSVRNVNEYDPNHAGTFIVGEINWNEFKVLKHRAEWHLLTEDRGVFIVYCDFEKKRIRNDYNWLNTFRSTYWGLVIVTCLLAILLSNVQMINSELRFNFDFFNSFSLIKGEGSIRSGLHLAILLGGCVIIAYYENHMTSIALVPDQPLIYPTVKELMQAGYKIKTSTSWYHVRALVAMTYKFDNDTKQLLYNGFQFYHTIEEVQNMRLDPSKRLAILVPGVRLRRSCVDNLKLLNPSAMCHYVPEPFEENRRDWMLFSGFLSDELASDAQLLLESGLRAFWREVASTGFEQYVVRQIGRAHV